MGVEEDPDEAGEIELPHLVSVVAIDVTSPSHLMKRALQFLRKW
jgi:hypothetical protein